MSTTNDRKLPMRALIGYPVMNVPPTLQMLIQMYFLLMFYTNYLGISGTAAAIIVMIARIWDLINDPIMGIILEKSRRPKKCIFFVRCAIVPVAIFIVLCYSAPQFSYQRSDGSGLSRLGKALYHYYSHIHSPKATISY